MRLLSLPLARLVLAAVLSCAIGAAQSQPQTYVVRVNADGTFTPQVLYVKSGDTVRWEQLTRTDSIIPVNQGAYPALCSSRKAFNPADPNEFTGPMPFAPSGVFALSAGQTITFHN